MRRADRWEGSIEVKVEGEKWTQKNNDQRSAAKKIMTVMQCGLRQGKNQMRKCSPSHGRDRQLDQITISYAPIGLIPPFNRAGLFLPVVSPLFLIRWQFVLPIVSLMSQCAAIKKYLNR